MKPQVNGYCVHCTKEGNKTKAIWYNNHRDIETRACELHKILIIDYVERDHYSEADYQTWMKL